MSTRLRAGQALLAVPHRVGLPRWSGAFFIALAVATRAPAIVMRRWLNPDEAAIAMTAQALRRGQTLYVDMADRKPPFAALVYRASSWLTGTDDARLARLVAAVLLGVAAWYVARAVAQQWGRRAGWWSGLLLVASAMAAAPADSAAANFSNLALPFAAAALVTLRRPSLGAALGGGVLLGIAVLFRQSWVFSIPGAACSVLLVPLAWPRRWGRLAAAGIGGLLPFLTVPLLAPFGDFWTWTFTGNGDFLFGRIDLGETLGRIAASVGLFLAWHLVLVAATVAAARRWPAWRVDIDLWVWLLGGLLAVAAGLRLFGHYWMQVLPPLAVLGGRWLGQAGRAAQRRAGALLAATAVVAVVFSAMPETFRQRPPTADLVAAIRQRCAPDERVFIWGSFPELAVEVQRPIAGGLVHTDFVVGRSGGHSEGRTTLDQASPGVAADMYANLLADLPAVIVDTSTSSRLGYENYPLDLLPSLRQLVEREYRPDAVVDGITLWTRAAPKTGDVRG